VTKFLLIKEDPVVKHYYDGNYNKNPINNLLNYDLEGEKKW
jgi:hypothetical protein